MADPKHLVRTKSLPPAEALHIKHPMNPNSDVTVQFLSNRVGMKRAQMSLARVPPGRESYVPHAHTTEEEWIFILEGIGRAQIGDASVEVGPGDDMGFPTDGKVGVFAADGVTFYPESAAETLPDSAWKKE